MVLHYVRQTAFREHHYIVLFYAMGGLAGLASRRVIPRSAEVENEPGGLRSMHLSQFFREFSRRPWKLNTASGSHQPLFVLSDMAGLGAKRTSAVPTEMYIDLLSLSNMLYM